MLPVLIPFLSAAVGTMVAQFVKVFSVESLKFIAWRAFILFLVFVCMPIVLYNVASDLILDLMTFAVGAVGDTGMSTQVVQLTGMGGWIGQQIGLPQSMATILSAVATRFTLSFIPFWGR